MDAGQRRLLPYEYQLIDALGITKDEYLEFVQFQGIYRDVKEGTELDIRNWEVAAIVIAVLGTTASVLTATVFAPKPPSASDIAAISGGGISGRRDAKFAPRYGFNSQQPLAIYGDPINLVYANSEANKFGGVRAAASLVWSAVRSFGSSQFVEMQMVLAGGPIGKIDKERSAFGQTPLRDIISQNYWIYFEPGATGQLKNGKNNTNDPSRSGGESDNPYRIAFDSQTKKDGFSQAYSPTNANQFGVYAPVPINTEIAIRNDTGELIRTKGTSLEGGNGITMIDPATQWPSRLYEYQLDQVIQVKLLKDAVKGFLAIPAAEERQGYATSFDKAGTYKLGAAVFKITEVTGNALDSDMIVTLKCIKKGKGSSIQYNAQRVTDIEIPVEELTPAEFKQVRRLALRMLRVDDRIVNDITGEIVTSGTTQNTRQVSARELAILGDLKILKKPKASKKLGQWNYEKPTEKELVRLIKYKVADKAGNITDEGKQILNRYADLTDASKGDIKNNYFYIKALTRFEEASYETLSPASIVDLAIKGQVYKSVSGRQPQYGSEQVASGYSQNDNGQKFRTSMFTIKFKHIDQTEYTFFPGVFVIRRKGNIDNYVYLRFLSHMNPRVWQFVLTPVFDIEAEVTTHSQIKSPDGVVRFHYIDNTLTDSKVTSVTADWPYPSDSVLENSSTAGTQLNSEWLQGSPIIQFTGRTRVPATQGKFFPPINKTPRGMNEWDLFTTKSDNNVNFSFENGPELQLLAVTEQTVESFQNYPSLYQDLSMIGLNMYSGRTIQDLRSFTVFVEQGRYTNLLDGSAGYPCHAPNIFYDTAINKVDGIGQYTSAETIDLDLLKASQKFCEKNNFFMEGVISEEKSWRSFWAEVAGYSMLEMAKIGGKDTLIPAVPYNSDGSISTNPVQVSALFNQGNILEGTYKEEFVDFGSSTQDVLISAIYREQMDENASDNNRVFALNQTVEVQYKDSDQATITRTTVDMSQYVTRRDQAIKVAKFLCALKRYTTKSIEFQTFPTASAIRPGDYIYVELAQNKWDNIFTGIIGPNGELNTAFDNPVPDGVKNFLIYNPNTGPKGVSAVNNVTVSNNTAPALGGAYAGQLFVLGTKVKNKRTFKVSEITMEEEGEITVKAMEHAVNIDGKSLVNMDVLGDDDLWLIDGN